MDWRQGKVREMSGNFVLSSLYEPCWGCEAYQVCSNDDPRLTLTYYTLRSNLLPNAFKWEFFFCKVDFLNTVEAKVIILT